VPTVLLQLPLTGRLTAPLHSSFAGANGAVYVTHKLNPAFSPDVGAVPPE